MVKIDYVKCNGVQSCPAHGICVDVCAVNAISVEDNRPIVSSDDCPDCGLCIMNCPNDAIQLWTEDDKLPQ